MWMFLHAYHMVVLLDLTKLQGGHVSNKSRKFTGRVTMLFKCSLMTLAVVVEDM